MAERHVGFIRAVMQGREGLTRDVLLDATRAAGGEEPSTHRSTGNVSFTAADGAAVCAALSQRLALVVGRPTPSCDACFVRAAPRGGHPMPLLEAAGVHPVTSRSIGTMEHIAEQAGQ